MLDCSRVLCHGAMSPNAEVDPEVEANRLRPVRQLSRNSALDFYRRVGHLVDDFPKPIVLADALVPDCPIVGLSHAFEQLSGYRRHEVLGENCRFMLGDVPSHLISRSGRKNLRSMIRMCRLIGLSTMGDTSCLQANRTKGGDIFYNHFAVGVVMLGEHPLLVGVQSPYDHGSGARLSAVRPEYAGLIEEVRAVLQAAVESQASLSNFRDSDFFLPRCRRVAGDRAFSPLALHDRVILLNDRRTVMRREPSEIPFGCVVVTDLPLRHTRQGLFFALRLEGVLAQAWHTSWPMLGMTRISPRKMAEDGYPERAECCGRSVCVGGDFEVFVREQAFHYTMGFGKTPDAEVQRFPGPMPRWQGSTTVPWGLGEGDVMGMLYTPEGAVHLMLNYHTVLSIDTGKPLESGEYYGLVDCRGAACEVMLLPYESPTVGYVQELMLQPRIDRKVMDHCFLSAVSRVVANCRFCVSIADPSQPDVPLVAVSSGFERMSGFAAADILGMNCRFLNHDCPMDTEERSDLRISCRTGRPFSRILQNRRRDGDIFLNLLDLRGLTIARDTETGEDIWYLVGIQSDVTELVSGAADGTSAHRDLVEEATSTHLRELQVLAALLREELVVEFGCLSGSSSPPAPRLRVLAPELDLSDGVAVPAVLGVQTGPKPVAHAMMALLPTPEWRPTSEEVGCEPEVVCPRGVAKGLCESAQHAMWKALPGAEAAAARLSRRTLLIGGVAFGTLSAVFICRSRRLRWPVS